MTSNNTMSPPVWPTASIQTVIGGPAFDSVAAESSACW
jgi:hypothetical protein